MPKRRGYILPELCENDNLEQGYHKSKHGKTYVYNMLKHREFDTNEVLTKLQQDFLQGTYKTSDYSVFKIYEPKERIIFRLPYAPDRIAHHAIMNVMEDFWTNKIPNTSYSCIKGRGVHGAYRYLKKCLNSSEYRYCLKGDIKKFFPSVNHRVLKRVVSKYIKDDEFLQILYEIIDSTDRYVEQTGNGVLGQNLPIGNYLSQYLANLIVAEIYKHLMKRFNGIKVIIYMDDLVILANNKKLLRKVKNYLQEILRKYKLELKANWQIFPVASQGISFVGFVFYPNRIMLRSRTVKKIFRLCYAYKNGRITKAKFKRSMASYYGWLKFTNSKYIAQQIYNLTGIWYSNWNGKVVKISTIYEENIRIYHIQKRSKYFLIEAVLHGKSIIVRSSNRKLLKNLLHLKKLYHCFNTKLQLSV